MSKIRFTFLFTIFVFSPKRQVTGALEYWSRKNGSSKDLSEQNLVDCVPNNHGCNGGDVRLGYLYTVAKGVANSTTYPYEGAKKTCRGSNQTSVFKPKNAMSLQLRGDEKMLHDLLLNFGPLSIAISTNSEV